ncbi:FAD-binding domain-containing protein [Rhodoferax sp.]|uniref:FAD-binding domain-containing protein n=1 Tax=Rhodoferax sp. TaxID=50421 RepID=UPI002ACD229B|nr:FAD-binding domain-containing protein [Rhodoferax sp.]MDZ7919175.1 FAD-binding domain-containing protein [Rhodoferax sp.]
MHQVQGANTDHSPSAAPWLPADPGPLLPTLAAAHARIAAVHPDAYARTRNALDGAVSGLSPYISHGFVTLAEVLANVNARHALDIQHKFVYELGWRAFFRHVWQHRGAAIWDSLHEGPLPDHAYTPALPEDIRQGRTGVPVVDMAVHTLYTTGTLHNHARMWLASYVVHLRKVHWRAGADWLYAHLLDGDLASNHLSWQWVAGTGSSKPYLFNADNVARFAPAPWHSPGSSIDTSYEALDLLARDPRAIAAAPHPGATPLATTTEPHLLTAPPSALGITQADAALVEGRAVWLVHPWSLGDLPVDLAPGTVVIGLYLSDFHRLWPWSEARWRFVGTRMAQLAPVCWHADAATIGQALRGASQVGFVAEPHLMPWLKPWVRGSQGPALFPAVGQPCTSFSQWWSRSTRGIANATELLALAKSP